jgi:hypothetical protein|tara:strand:- start:576 stop:779 length:204 start_codon:yes stop_codon:yes gene_type:complete
MPEISKLTKAQLIDIIQQQEENKYAVLKEELGLPYNTDEEWVDYIKGLQTSPDELIKQLKASAMRVY